MAKKIDEDILKPSIERYNSGESVKSISDNIGVSVNTIRRFLKKNGIVFKHSKPKIAYVDAIEDFKVFKGSLAAFCKENGMSAKWFGDYLRANGVIVENKQNKVRFNQNVFDNIDTEEKAYWLGFIYADGYISYGDTTDKKPRYDFELSLQGSDFEHLEKFNAFMEHENNNVKISKVNCGEVVCSRCRWGVRNKHMWHILNNYGCTPNKSLTLEFPNSDVFESKDLIIHFIRGYFDGDGCISYSNKEHSEMFAAFLGTENFLLEVQNHLGIVCALQNANSKSENTITKEFQIQGKSTYEVLSTLYENATIYLDRKFERYQEVCRLYE